MEQAEVKLSEIKEKILIEQYNLQNQLKREQVVEFLQHTILQSPAPDDTYNDQKNRTIQR